MKKIYLPLFLILFPALTSFANSPQQTVTVCGSVRDSSNDTALGYSTVSFISVANTDHSYGTVSDNDGRFEISLPAGRYRLFISFLGYVDVDREYELSGNTDLGELALKLESTDIEEVTVYGERIVREADRFVWNVEGSSLAVGKTGSQILSYAPGVWVQPNSGDISINGRGGVLRSWSTNN